MSGFEAILGTPLAGCAVCAGRLCASLVLHIPGSLPAATPAPQPVPAAPRCAPSLRRTPPSRPGRVLKGRLTLGQLRRGSGSAPASHALRYVVPPPVNKDAAGGGSKKKDEGEEDKKDAATKVGHWLRGRWRGRMPALLGPAACRACPQ
jgi:hypothetical protein